MDNYQQYIALSRYARYLPEEQRRETWSETVNRYISFFEDRGQITKETGTDLVEAILNLEVMPSMRCLMTAGEALHRDNVAGFNCSYLALDHPRAFDELMYILMCGTGVGFSCERQYISKLPEIAEEMHDTDTVINVADSKIGWASAFRELLSLLWAGKVPTWDVSKVRPAGAPLKTFGGRASGPAPLEDLFTFTVELFKANTGKNLSSIDCHDLACKIADIVVVGGVRRSALISLSNPSDDRMRVAKSGQWWVDNPQRALANNSACYTEKPDLEQFMKESVALYESKSGERGFFSRKASQNQAAKNGRRDSDWDFGTNPCSEIILRPNQFCNLSEVVVRAEDTEETLLHKVELATILGTLQSTMTNFRYLRKVWKNNTEEECLLGVSLTGIMDNELTNGTAIDSTELGLLLERLKNRSIEVNKKWAEALGVNPSVAITCVKPSGTVSQLVNSASGIHPRFSPQYIRTVRADKKDPLSKWMVENNYPHEEDVINPSNFVFSFPILSPKGSICTKDVTAIEQLKLWKIYQESWCEHKPSITVYYSDEEFLATMAWLYENFDDVSGVSFLPRSEHTYKQAPYQEITYDQYLEAKVADDASTSFNDMSLVEDTDNVEGVQTLSCTGGVCEI